MAGLCCGLPKDITHHPKVGRRPSLYTSVQIARFVYHVKERLKCRTKQRSQRKNDIDQPQISLHVQVRQGFDWYVSHLQTFAFDPNSNHRARNRVFRQPAGKDDVANQRLRLGVPLCVHRDILVYAATYSPYHFGFLEQLDRQAADAEPKTSTVASCDQLFLAYNARDVTRHKGIDALRYIYDLTTSLLARLPVFLGCIASHCWPRNSSTSASNDLKQDKFSAGLDHVLRCLRQASLEALVYLELKSFEEEDIQQWHRHWLQGRQLDQGWFLEWPNGRRPLSTTWPWNIRPSLVVLWGVCWMFYDNSTRSVDEMRQQLVNNQEVASSFWARQTPQSATASQRKP